MAESRGSAQVVRTVMGVIALVVVVVVGIIIARPYLAAGPKRVAKQFLAAVARQDLDAARELMTTETRTTDANNLKRVVTDGSTFTIGEMHQRGNFATVDFTDQDGEAGQVMLQQRDGRWQVYGDGRGPFMAPEDDTADEGSEG